MHEVGGKRRFPPAGRRLELTVHGARRRLRPMLLVIDVGNTNIVFGAYDGSRLVHSFRVQTKTGRTGDEYGILVKQLFQHVGIELGQFTAAICSSVVPPMQFTLEQM